jgi:hypothetical protein
MNNYFAQLYLDLSSHLNAQVPELRWIDQDFGQLEHFQIRPEVSFPCALIDFLSGTYSELAGVTQFGEVMVSIRIGFAPFSSSYHAAPDNVKEKALEYYNLEQKVYKAVQGWTPVADGIQYSQPFIRQSVMTEQRDGDQNALRVRVLTFATAYEDNSAATVTTTEANPNLKIEEVELI